MLDDFFMRALVAGVGLALTAGPLGCFVVWRRMAYFGDSTAHAAILGVALALALDLPIGLGTLVVSLGVAVAVATLAARGWAMDTTLGVLAHSALAFGLLAASFVPEARTDLSAYLFGDILAVSRTDLAFIWLGALAVVALLVLRWSALLTATLTCTLPLIFVGASAPWLINYRILIPAYLATIKRFGAAIGTLLMVGSLNAVILLPVLVLNRVFDSAFLADDPRRFLAFFVQWLFYCAVATIVCRFLYRHSRLDLAL